jgi:DNA topoisomerase-1
MSLIIVESATKAKKISQLLGKGYIIKASNGHINQLSKEKMGINIENGFTPSYSVIPEKIKLLKELKEAVKSAKNVILAGDADREGEAISWHIANELKLPIETTPRITFNEITKEALLAAIENPRVLDMNLINAQQARAILDKLVGFEISPILWKQIQPNLSAGRVQTPLLHLIMEHEIEIEKFKAISYFRTIGSFVFEENKNFTGLLDKKFNKIDEVKKFMGDIYNSNFSVSPLKKKSIKIRKPTPPFTTASLLQDAVVKCHMNSKSIMDSSQKLFESGKITYHRTDSTNISVSFLNDIKTYIISTYSSNYYKLRNYKTKIKCAQEAHEAIRPTDVNLVNLTDDFGPNEKKIYSLIWKRTTASQMADASFNTISVNIENSKRNELFNCYGEECTFDGFLKVYSFHEETDENDTIPESSYNILYNLNGPVKMEKITSDEKMTSGPGHYNEAQLIKLMQDTGIGRPSTYSSMINKIQERAYVIKDNREGKKMVSNIVSVNLKGDINCITRDIVLNRETAKLFPTDTGRITDTFMKMNFSELVNSDYTSVLENKLDMIANGEINWKTVVQNFYEGFHPIVKKFLEMKPDEIKEKTKYMRIIGNDTDGNQIITRIGPFGAIVQSGTKEENNIKCASLEGSQTIDTITLGEAIELLKYPRSFGMYNGHLIILKKGKFGPYIEYNKQTYSLKSGNIHLDDITREKAIVIITMNEGYISKKK